MATADMVLRRRRVASAPPQGSTNLRLRVELEGVDAPATEQVVPAADRVGAVGGQLVVESTGRGGAMSAEMPCAS